MKNLINIFFVLVIGLSSFRMIFPFIEYAFNFKYISEELCENVEETELKCNGKCYLAKQIKKAKEQKSQEEKKTTSFNFLETELFCENQFDFKLFNCLPNLNKPIDSYRSFHYPLIKETPVPPPKV